MNGNEYQELAMRTNDGKCTDRLEESISFFKETAAYPITGDLINACLGLSGEVGEVTDMVKKYIFHGHKLNQIEIIKEAGDILWYVAMLCNSMDINMETVMKLNIEKLNKRYPDGFSEQASINRKE